MKILVLLFSFNLIFTSKILSQDNGITIEAQIKDSKGTSVSFASIVICHSRQGAVASKSGYFKLNSCRLNDTILISRIGFKPNYFVVKRAYDFINFTMQLDTLVFKEEYETLQINSNYEATRPQLTCIFSETTKKVIQEKSTTKDDSRFFLKAESPPYIKSGISDFVDSLKISLKKYNNLITPINLSFYFTISDTLQIVNVKGNCSSKTKNIISSVIKKKISVQSAKQNSHKVSVLSLFRLKVYKFNKGVKVDLVN